MNHPDAVRSNTLSFPGVACFCLFVCNLCSLQHCKEMRLLLGNVAVRRLEPLRLSLQAR